MKSQKNSLTAVKLRVLLGIAIALLIAGGVGVFTFGNSQLTSYAEQVSQKRSEADASSNTLSDMQSLQIKLQEYDDLSELLNTIRASGDFPQFQAVEDLSNIAARNGVGITDIAFVNTSDAAGSDTGTTQQQAPAQGSGEATPATPSVQAGDSVQITFNIDGSVSYETLIRFLHDIETNTPKMQIQSVNLPADSNAGSVDPGQLTLSLYVR